MSKEFPITEFDRLTLPNSFQIFKALIPFMDYGMQRSISTLIRTNELLHTQRFYKTPFNCQQFQSCSARSHISFNTSINDIMSNDEIVNMVLKYCPENTEKMFNQFKSYSTMSDLFNMYGNTFSGKSTANPFNESSLLNPVQQKLYNDYIQQLDEMESKNNNNNNKTNNNGE